MFVLNKIKINIKDSLLFLYVCSLSIMTTFLFIMLIISFILIIILLSTLLKKNYINVYCLTTFLFYFFLLFFFNIYIYKYVKLIFEFLFSFIKKYLQLLYINFYTLMRYIFTSFIMSQFIIKYIILFMILHIHSSTILCNNYENSNSQFNNNNFLIFGCGILAIGIIGFIGYTVYNYYNSNNSNNSGPNSLNNVQNLNLDNKFSIETSINETIITAPIETVSPLFNGNFIENMTNNLINDVSTSGNQILEMNEIAALSNNIDIVTDNLIIETANVTQNFLNQISYTEFDIPNFALSLNSSTEFGAFSHTLNLFISSDLVTSNLARMINSYQNILIEVLEYIKNEVIESNTPYSIEAFIEMRTVLIKLFSIHYSIRDTSLKLSSTLQETQEIRELYVDLEYQIYTVVHLLTQVINHGGSFE